MQSVMSTYRQSREPCDAYADSPDPFYSIGEVLKSNGAFRVLLFAGQAKKPEQMERIEGFAKCQSNKSLVDSHDVLRG